MISVIDYGAGNSRSVINMIKSLGHTAQIVGTPEELSAATRIILPGVGHFDSGMDGLNARGLVGILRELVIEDRLPFLGICLGAQIIARRSDEGQRRGLGWIAADVVAFDRSRLVKGLSVPHMGWAETWVAPNAQLPCCFRSALAEDARFYYLHSFHLACDDHSIAVLRASHGYEFAAGVCQANVIGAQFHPEKSHRFGRAFLQAFIEWKPNKQD